MVLFEIHRRFKGHFLNELRVSFKDPFDGFKYPSENQVLLVYTLIW